MSIVIVVNSNKDKIPANSIRADLAWSLFLPEYVGGLPEGSKGGVEPIRHWLWEELGKCLGFLHKHPPNPQYVIAPILTDAGKEFLVRTCSLWSTEVFLAENGSYDPESPGENLWQPPIVNVKGENKTSMAQNRLSEDITGASHTYYSALLGAGKSNIRAYTIKPNHTYSRFHSHSALDEIYLVISGSGSIRIADQHVTVSEGDLISKPAGPDIPTQFLADKGENMRILDLEIWPDDERRSKDLINYADHAELDLSGTGWDFTIPSDSVMGSGDAMGNYETGYRRKVDGSWEAADVPGYPSRKGKK